jgi:hypothetical protein
MESAVTFDGAIFALRNVEKMSPSTEEHVHVIEIPRSPQYMKWAGYVHRFVYSPSRLIYMYCFAPFASHIQISDMIML